MVYLQSRKRGPHPSRKTIVIVFVAALTLLLLNRCFVPTFEKQTYLLRLLSKAQTEEGTSQTEESELESEPFICPSNEEQDKAFPPGMPQNLTFGKFFGQSARPFLGSDVWYDIADNKRVFFLRYAEDGFPDIGYLKKWVASRSHPITLLMNNQIDQAFPPQENEKEAWKELLDEPNLHAFYAVNARRWDEYPKVKPLPIGLKWNFRSTMLFSEDKLQIKNDLFTITASPEASRDLFESKRGKHSIYLRPMTRSRKMGRSFELENVALSTPRGDLHGIVNGTAPLSLVANNGKIARPEYFEELKKHRFVLSPQGNGLDTHGTWEAFLAGTIPIVPHSPLDPQFEGLPIWLINDWNEVTDEMARQKSEEFASKSYKWVRAFAAGWKEEVYKGLCKTILSDE